jgi:DNA repair protein RecO (recombination protein O)
VPNHKCQWVDWEFWERSGGLTPRRSLRAGLERGSPRAALDRQGPPGCAGRPLAFCAGTSRNRPRPNTIAGVSAEKSLAIVIRMADFSESSRVVTLFTRDFGKIAVVAKGAKRLKGPFEAALDLLTVCEVVFLRKSSSGLDILTEAQLRQRFRPRNGELGNLYGGYYVAELLDALSEEYDAHPVLYDEACGALERFAGELPLVLTITRFELSLLREIGQLPLFDACVACGEPIGPSRKFTFKVTQGGLICSSCLFEQTPQNWIQPAIAEILRVLSDDSTPDWQHITITAPQVQQVRSILNSTIAGVLGRRPKMYRYLPF